MMNCPRGALGSSVRAALEVVAMSVEQTQRTLDRYFGLMGQR